MRKFCYNLFFPILIYCKLLVTAGKVSLMANLSCFIRFTRDFFIACRDKQKIICSRKMFRHLSIKTEKALIFKIKSVKNFDGKLSTDKNKLSKD